MSLSTVTFYPVDNGNMTFIKLNDENETTFLVDMHIRVSATDDRDVETFDVLNHLKNQLKKDSNGHPYIDAFLLTHNDEDHIKGIKRYFHLGSINDYEDEEDEELNKIILYEIWSSGRFWKRASTYNPLQESAKAFNDEMKRRVSLYQVNNKIQLVGDRAIIICEDDEGKTDDLSEIIRPLDSEFSIINELDLSHKISIKILNPIHKQDDEDEIDFKYKNRGSVIINVTIKEGANNNQILLTGDAPVFVWEKLYEKYNTNLNALQYDILLTPHHCSWHSISHDSYSQSENPKISTDALLALSQTKTGAYIISSSKPIKSDDNDPPSSAAKEEYKKLVYEGHFLCTEEYPYVKDVEPIVFNLSNIGVKLIKREINKMLSDSFNKNFSHLTKNYFDVPHREKPMWRMLNLEKVNISAQYKKNGYWYDFKNDDNKLEKNLELLYTAHTSIPRPFEVYWQVINTGYQAERENCLRGTIFQASSAGAGGLKQKESTKYTGKHCIICYIVKDIYCHAKSDEFILNVKL